jgi:hypothetical protein
MNFGKAEWKMLNNPKKYTIREEISDPLHKMSLNLFCKLSWAPSAELLCVYTYKLCVCESAGGVDWFLGFFYNS